MVSIYTLICMRIDGSRTTRRIFDWEPKCIRKRGRSISWLEKVAEDACQMKTSVDVLADRAKNRADGKGMIAVI